MKNEKPHLLNPEQDAPEDYLEFCRDGEVIPKNNNLRGRATIEICNLNRGDLKINGRKQMLDGFIAEIGKQLRLLKEKWRVDNRNIKEDSHLALDTILRKILKSQQPDHKYSGMGRCICNDISRFILDPVEQKIKSDGKKWRDLVESTLRNIQSQI